MPYEISSSHADESITVEHLVLDLKKVSPLFIVDRIPDLLPTEEAQPAFAGRYSGIFRNDQF